MYKAVFIDIDGTLRNSKKQLTQKTIDTVKKVTEKGVLVVLCSGRPRKYTEDVSRACHASRYIITSGGGDIYDYEEEKILYLRVMNKKALLELYEIAEKVDARYIMNVDAGRVVTKVKYPDQDIKLTVPIKEFVYSHDVVQCVIEDSDFDKINSIIPDVEKIKSVEIKNRHKSLVNSSFTREGSIYCDVANVETSKGSGIVKLCEILNIDLKDTIGIGDDNNDMSMFETVRI